MKKKQLISHNDELRDVIDKLRIRLVDTESERDVLKSVAQDQDEEIKSKINALKEQAETIESLREQLMETEAELGVANRRPMNIVANEVEKLMKIRELKFEGNTHYINMYEIESIEKDDVKTTLHMASGNVIIVTDTTYETNIHEIVKEFVDMDKVIF